MLKAWIIEEKNESDIAYRVYMDDKKETEQICEIFRSSEEGKTDARAKLIVASPLLLNTVHQCQDVLAEYILPDSKTTDDECINKLIGILDAKPFAKITNELKESFKTEE